MTKRTLTTGALLLVGIAGLALAFTAWAQPAGNGNGNGTGAGAAAPLEQDHHALVAEQLGISAELLAELLDAARAQALADARAAGERPMQLNARIYAILADRLGLTVEQVETAFEAAHAQVWAVEEPATQGRRGGRALEESQAPLQDDCQRQSAINGRGRGSAQEDCRDATAFGRGRGNSQASQSAGRGAAGRRGRGHAPQGRGAGGGMPRGR